MKNIGQLMKQAQAMQEKMAEMQAELEAVEMTGVAGAGMVELTLNGKSDVKKVKIDKSLLDPAEVEVLEDLIVAAFTDARRKVSAHAEAGNAEADRRPAAAGRHEAAVLKLRIPEHRASDELSSFPGRRESHPLRRQRRSHRPRSLCARG